MSRLSQSIILFWLSTMLTGLNACRSEAKLWWQPELLANQNLLKLSNEPAKWSVDELNLFFKQTVGNQTPMDGPSLLSQGRYPLHRSMLGPDELLIAQACINCHPAQHKNWQSNLHSKAATNPRFVAAFEVEPAGWCLNCHAPLWWENSKLGQGPDRYPTEFILAEEYGAYPAIFSSSPDYNTAYKSSYTLSDLSPLAMEGVNCATCHLRAGKIISPRPVTGATLRQSPHTVKYDPNLASPEFCAGCHQFPFPRRYWPHVGYTQLNMQNTWNEFRKAEESALAAGHEPTTCASCHYQNGHLAQPTGPKQWTIDCRIRLTPSKVTSVQVFRSRVGHALPTGDNFRTIALRLFDSQGNVLASEKFGRVIDRAQVRLKYNRQLHPTSERQITFKKSLPGIGAAYLQFSYHLQGEIEEVLLHKGLSMSQLVLTHRVDCLPE